MISHLYKTCIAGKYICQYFNLIKARVYIYIYIYNLKFSSLFCFYTYIHTYMAKYIHIYMG